MNENEQAWEDARQAGIDLSLLEANLALSVKERWQQHDSALALVLKLEEAGRALHGGFKPTAEAHR